MDMENIVWNSVLNLFESNASRNKTLIFTNRAVEFFSRDNILNAKELILLKLDLL